MKKLSAAKENEQGDKEVKEKEEKASEENSKKGEGLKKGER
jgi:hypothetical protein